MVYRMYELCRFGRHIPFAKESLRDALLRIPTRYPVANSGECDNFLNQVERHMGDNKSLIARLKVVFLFGVFQCTASLEVLMSKNVLEA